jgi:hypothetical protein
VLPNERFTGAGHRAHVCRPCRRLGSEELAARQALRNIDQALGQRGVFREAQRPMLEGLLSHSDERVRLRAASALASIRRWDTNEVDGHTADDPPDIASASEGEADSSDVAAWCDEERAPDSDAHLGFEPPALDGDLTVQAPDDG